MHYFKLLPAVLQLSYLGSQSVQPQNYERDFSTPPKFSKCYTRAVNYSPMHNPSYPLDGKNLNVADLERDMYQDFALINKSYGIVKTYFSSYYGVGVAKIAHESNVKLYLGIYVTSESWYENQVNDAIQAVKDYPDTVLALVVGNEDVDTYKPDGLINLINDVKKRLQASVGTKYVPVGTAQTNLAWTRGETRGEMMKLADACDIIYYNQYTFFNPLYNDKNPLDLMYDAWGKMKEHYPNKKILLGETGYPTDGGSSIEAPNNQASLDNALYYYRAFLQYCPGEMDQSDPVFWFMMFDLRDQSFDGYFGHHTISRKQKGPYYPLTIAQEKGSGSTNGR